MKTIRTFILGLLLLPLIGLKAQPVQLSMPETTAVRGPSLLIPVRVDQSLTGLNVTSYQIMVQYNDYVLAFDSVITAETMSQTAGMTAMFSSPRTNLALVAAAGAAPLDGQGTLFYLRFRMIRSGWSELTFQGSGNSLFNEGSPALTFDNGSVNVSEPASITIYPENAVLSVGEQIQCSAYGGTGPYLWNTLDPTLAAVDGNGLVTGLKPGKTRIIITDATGLRDTSNGIYEIRALRLFMNDTATYTDRTIDLPVYCSDVTGLGIVSGEFTVNFNGDIVTPVGVVKTGTMTDQVQVYYNRPEKNRISVAIAGSEPLAGQGVLCYLRFTTGASPGGVSFDLGGGMMNESIPAKLKGSYVNVQSMASVGVSPMNASVVVGDSLQFTTWSGTGPFTWSVSDPAVGAIDNDGLFRALASGTAVVTAHDAMGATGTTNAIRVYNAQVSLDTRYAVAGGVSDVPVVIQKFAGGPSVSSAQVTIEFDPTYVQVADVLTAGTLSGSWSKVQNISSNRVTVALAGVTGFHTTGTLFTLRLNIAPSAPENASLYLRFIQCLFNEGSPTAMTLDQVVVVTGVPPAPGLGTPYNTQNDLPRDVTFRWGDTYHAEYYQLQVALDETFTRLVADRQGLTVLEQLVTGLQPETTYYWRVRASNVAGFGAWSEVRQCTIARVLPDAPQPASPPNTMTDLPVDVTLSWYAAARAARYQVQLAFDNGFTRIVLDDTVLSGLEKPVTGLLGDSTYYWRVRGLNDDGTGPWSDVWYFIIGTTRPAQTYLESPGNGSTDMPVDLTLSWYTASRADRYVLEVAYDNAFTRMVARDTVTGGVSKTVAGLQGDSTYYWRVRALNAYGIGDWSEVWSFTVGTTRPAQPSLESPGSGSADMPVDVALTWYTASRADSYLLQVAHDDAFTRIVANDTVTGGLGKTVTGLQGDSIYYWRVRGLNAVGTGPWSDTWNFTVGTTLPGQTWLESPGNGSTNMPVDVALTWYAALRADNYVLQIAYDDAFTHIVANDTLTGGLGTTVTGLLGDSTYYWRVRGFNAVGVGAWSEVWNFTVGTTRPDMPSLESPGNGATDQPVDVTLTWFTASRAGLYVVQVAHDDAFTRVVVVDTLMGGLSKTVTGLHGDSVYYWRVRAINEYGVSPWSDVWWFRTVMTQVTLPVALDEGWNIISLPVLPADPSVSTLFPMATASVYGYSTNYDIVTTLESDKGYWLKTNAAQTVEITGSMVSGPFTVPGGWTIIGPRESSVPVSAIVTIPPGIRTTSFFGFQNGSGYFVADTLKSGKGYWVKTTTAGELTTGGLPKNAVVMRQPEAEWGTLLLRDAAGRSMRLYAAPGGTETEPFALPPVPPAGIFDVRFSDGTYVENLGSGKIVSIQGAKFPLTVTAERADLHIEDAAGGILFSHTLKRGTQMTIASSMLSTLRVAEVVLPKEFELDQNYPNPFNPRTSIRFGVPDDGWVRLTVYNLVGQIIAVPVDGVMEAGYHTVGFEASRLPSGTYFYRLETGTKTMTKKMMLLK